jgi:hypothetical protein
MDNYPMQDEVLLTLEDARNSRYWRGLTRALGFPLDATFDAVLSEIRKWRAWADVVRIGVMTAIPDDEPDVIDPEW